MEKLGGLGYVTKPRPPGGALLICSGRNIDCERVVAGWNRCCSCCRDQFLCRILQAPTRSLHAVPTVNSRRYKLSTSNGCVHALSKSNHADVDITLRPVHLALGLVGLRARRRLGIRSIQLSSSRSGCYTCGRRCREQRYASHYGKT